MVGESFQMADSKTGATLIGKRNDLEAIQQAGVTQDAQVPGHPGLALAQHLGQFSLGQLSTGAQTEQAQTGGVCTGFESLQQDFQTGLRVRHNDIKMSLCNREDSMKPDLPEGKPDSMEFKGNRGPGRRI